VSEKKRLGKGLGALIPEVLAVSPETSEIELAAIKPNPFQPRKNFDDEKLRELSASIKEHGVIQAVVLTKGDNDYEYILIAGERRCRAAQIAGLTKVPAVVRDIDRGTMLEIALIENLQRENLNPIEEAAAYRKLMDEFNYTQEELAKRIGKSRPTIANSLRLLSLSEPVKELLEKGEITPGQARPLLSISDRALQYQSAIKIIEEGLSSRVSEQIAAETGRKKRIKGEKEIHQEPLLQELQLQMQRVYGTKVLIKRSKNGGAIEIYYYSEDDLERLVTKLLPDGL
jgi:ParB family transcriptional regulator, chromosome partitioning protein